MTPCFDPKYIYLITGIYNSIFSLSLIFVSCFYNSDEENEENFTREFCHEVISKTMNLWFLLLCFDVFFSEEGLLMGHFGCLLCEAQGFGVYPV